MEGANVGAWLCYCEQAALFATFVSHNDRRRKREAWGEMGKRLPGIGEFAAAVGIAATALSVGIWIARVGDEPAPRPLWTGTWQTNTATYKSLRVSFIQDQQRVSGSYAHPSEGEPQVRGEITATADRIQRQQSLQPSFRTCNPAMPVE